MSVFRRKRKEAQLILFFTILKFVLHLFANSNFGFHRDELLYIALGEHLDWGFKEVPPFISIISWIGTHIFGGSVFAVRLLPSLAGAMTVYLCGLMALNMGGKLFAISVACLGMIFSPAFLASQYLLQPVVFDQLFWVLSAYFAMCYVHSKNTSYLYWLGAAVGLGMLNKYTMALYAGALVLGILFSSQRKLLFNKYVLGAAGLALLIFSPNLIWQLTHKLPVISHMKELKETQLEYVSPTDFIFEQLLVHASGILIWLPALVYLFFSRVRRKFVFLSTAYIITIAVLILLHGKPYYCFGAYPALFAAGGVFWQKILSRLKEPTRFAILGACIVPMLVFVPMVIPILPFPSSLKFFEFTATKLKMDFALKWEDQKIHATTQDYADMLGWDEIASGVEKTFKLLDPNQRKHTTVFAENYGMAGAADHLGKRYNLPPTVCLSSSYALWAPDSIQTATVIYVGENTDRIGRAYKNVVKVAEVNNPYAREYGTGVYLLTNPLVNINPKYKAELEARR